MKISKEYRDAIKRRIVVDFIKDQQRSPTPSELLELLNTAYKKYEAIDEVGFCGFDLERPSYSDSSSAALEMLNKETMARDQEVLQARLKSLSSSMEESFRSFISSINRNYKYLTKIESRVDSLLLLNGQSDIFLNGIEETFDNHQHVDYELTDATVADGYVTIGRGGYRLADLTTANLKHMVIAPQGILSKRISSSIDSLIEDDGKFWEYILYTDYETGRISLVLEIEFQEPTYVSDIRLGIAPSSVSKQMTANFFASLDGKVFNLIGDPELPITQQSFLLNVGLDEVKKLQILLSKDAFDTKSADNKQNVYTFSLDSLKLYTDPYKNLVSTVVCGPYPVIDAEDSEINFTKAKLSACTIEPIGTSIDFYLSNDGETWTHASHDNSSSNLVLFGTSEVGNSIGYIDGAVTAGVLVESSDDVEALEFATEALLNGYITGSAAAEVAIETIVLKRNINTDYDSSTVLSAERGWKLDTKTNRYSTTIYIDALEGRSIDFGPKPVLINGRECTGLIKLNQGYSVVEVSDASFGIVIGGLTTLAELKTADPLYPYNHKLLISGYDYPGSFSEDRVYLGADEFFATKMRYIAPDFFAFIEPTEKNYYDVFTLEDVDGTLYFKVKVNKTDASWSEELFSMTWLRQTTNTNQLWVKALLSTDSVQNSPKLESFSVQVI
jgi:hypothetical protein